MHLSMRGQLSEIRFVGGAALNLSRYRTPGEIGVYHIA
jgi:hypothetical protein